MCPALDTELMDARALADAEVAGFLEDRFDDDNVIGAGYGGRTAGGVTTAEPSVIVLVKAKLGRSQVARDRLVPPQLAGVRTDVVPVGAGFQLPPSLSPGPTDLKAIRVAPPLAQRARPAEGGAGLGHPGVSGGTLGVRAAGPGGEAYILSNNHVLANRGMAAAGDPITQPARVDGGVDPRDTIARLARWAPLDLPPAWNRMDAAVAAVVVPPGCELDGVVSPDIARIGPVTSWRASADIPVGLKVAKCGMETELSAGVVFGVWVRVKVHMWGMDPLWFEEQLVCTCRATGGDSGSLLVAAADRSAVGLVFATTGPYTFASPIEAVQGALGVTVSPHRWPAGGIIEPPAPGG